MKLKKEMQLTSNFRIKTVSEDKESITIEGFANTTNKDRAGDVILEEAWTKGGMDNFMINPIVLAFHNHERPIGEVVEYSINNEGLRVVAEISKAAGDVYNLVMQGILKAFSVGFRVKDADYDSDTDIFVIKDLELYELSVVSIPANAESIFSVKKSFKDEEEYNEFKDSFNNDNSQDLDKNLDNTDKKGEQTVDKDDIVLTPEQVKDLQDKAIAKAFADKKAADEKNAEIAAIAAEAGTSGAERLIKELESKFEDKEKTMSESLESFKTELKEKQDEIIALTTSKMHFEDKRSNNQVKQTEIDKFVLTAKIMNKSITELDSYKAYVEKAGDHLGGMTTPDDWETLFSTNLYSDVQDKLVLEPLFSNRVAMKSRTLVFPYNPEAGHASWVADTAYKSTDGSSTGVARTHTPADNLLKAEKLASKEFLGYEEEEDSIIAVAPIVRNAIVRRMARTTDTELLRGNVGVETVAGQTGLSLINGVATYAADNSATVTQGGVFGTSNPVTIADLQATRRKLGSYGLNPSDVVYLVCESAYYDLLEDPDFRTMDLVGANATILRGQIGTVNGSPVIVSDTFATPALGTVAAVALNAANYLFGELRGMMVERDRDIENQKNLLIATRRFAFNELIPGAKSSAAK
jgi:HK97 family phage prohead protease